MVTSAAFSSIIDDALHFLKTTLLLYFMLALDLIIGIKPEKCLQMETISLLIMDVLNFLNFDFWKHSFFACMGFIIKP